MLTSFSAYLTVSPSRKARPTCSFSSAPAVITDNGICCPVYIFLFLICVAKCGATFPKKRVEYNKRHEAEDPPPETVTFTPILRGPAASRFSASIVLSIEEQTSSSMPLISTLPFVGVYMAVLSNTAEPSSAVSNVRTLMSASAAIMIESTEVAKAKDGILLISAITS